MTIILIVLATAGVSLLWRTYRYDSENSFNVVLDAWPFWIRKPLTCGLCFTFWIALIVSGIFSPFTHLIGDLPYRVEPEYWTAQIVAFLVGWLALGTLSVFVLYLIDTLFQISHYFKHAAHSK
ncbi:MAG: hypothetical protein JWN18_257 [Parcubacteria group bacterium]|nr:hypothetical protein [Parcubacteria group bacterium]